MEVVVLFCYGVELSLPESFDVMGIYENISHSQTLTSHGYHRR